MSQVSVRERRPPREFWLHEARDFTPWMAENLSFLSESLNMELAFEAREKSVGEFRADLVCRNAVDNSRVVIENQLTRSDHSHLGQVLTYAAGLQAVTVVWVAAELRREHRATLEWQNKITDVRFRFFGVELRTWRDRISHFKVELSVVSKPVGWTHSASLRQYPIRG